MNSNDEQSLLSLVSPYPIYSVLGALGLGSVIGGIRNGRTSSLRFLAENTHRPPRTKEGWYYYHRTKNYRIATGAMQGALREGGRLGAITAVVVGLAESLHLAAVTQGGKWEYVSPVRHIVASVTSVGLLSAYHRLPPAATRKALLLGLGFGCAWEASNIVIERVRSQKTVVSEEG